MAVRGFSASSFAIRWVVAMVLVLGTFNPYAGSYYHWITPLDEGGNIPFKILVGLGILIVYIVFLRATWRSIGAVGTGLAVAFFGVLVWLMIDNNMLDPENVSAMSWVGLIVLATILAIGMSWSHIRRRISGQMDTDVVDE
ncbi:MAG: DUF6524 family protein [Alphaproteobacteria bacterium]|jgi:hypothetical protein|nr:DUF6524 family protein [Alphaproteobacteria bacterium]